MQSITENAPVFSSWPGERKKPTCSFILLIFLCVFLFIVTFFFLDFIIENCKTTAIGKAMMSNTCQVLWLRELVLLYFKLQYFGLVILLLAQYSIHRVEKQLEDMFYKYDKALTDNSWEGKYYGL